MKRVAQWKQEALSEIVEAISSNPVVGIINIKGIPSPQMQIMRRSMRGKAIMLSSKNTILSLAIKEAAKQKKGIDKLLPLEPTQTAIIATKFNPFKLYKEMEATKTKAPAKGGETATEDIIVKKGDTPFKPGPVVGELQKVGIPAAIEGGKVIIKKDVTVVKKGGVISRELAQVLGKLDIMPLVVGLDLKMVYEDGLVYKREALAFDDKAMIENMILAAQQSMALALEISYVTKETIAPLIQKAFRNAIAVSVESGIPNKENLHLLLAKATAQANALSSIAKL